MTAAVIAQHQAELPGSEQNSNPIANSPIANAHSVLFVHLGERAIEPPSSPAEEPVFFIPFFHEAKGCEETHADFKEGHDLHPDTKNFLRELAGGLLHCAGPEQHVKVEVVGFASSSPFENCGAQRSEELNRRIANARAVAVEQVLRKTINDAGTGSGVAHDTFEIRIREWSGADDMQRQVRFNDRRGREYSRKRAVLTRRAELRVTDPGDCRVVTPSSTKPPASTVGAQAASDEPRA